MKMIKKLILILFLFNSIIFSKDFSINVLSWKLSNSVFYEGNLKNKLTNYLNNKDLDIIVFQNLKQKLNLKLNNKFNIYVNNKFNIYVNNNNYYLHNSYYSFYIDKDYIMSEVYQYPDYLNIWQFPPVMLYVPKLDLAIISIEVNNNYKSCITLTGTPYTYIKRNVYDIKNVLDFFIKKNINLHNIIITGDFGLDDSDITKILSYPTLLKDKRITIKNHNYGNYNYNSISFIKSISAKVLTDTTISNYYPIMISYN
jgi:hypothetical protein